MSRKLKLVIIALMFAFQYFNFNNIVSAENSTDKYFIVTAYYSPLPDQKHYTTGSYWWDIKLNWKGHTTASWKPVEVWLLAWPKNYPYGTKIYFDWFWVWVIEDRWGAIVKAWVRWFEHDRIDIWMWYGDEWLMRAKKWWRRTIKGSIVNPSSEVTLKLSENVLLWYEDLEVWPESDSTAVLKLQELFTKLWLYKEELDWDYKKIEDDILDFQIKNRIISDASEWWAWYFWDKTKLKLIKKYFPNPLIKEESKPKIVEIDNKVKIIMDYWDLVLKPESTTQDIQKVQELFTKLELYTWNIDWNYETIKDSLIRFQKEVWLVNHEDDWWAWYMWDKTKTLLIKYFEDKATRKKDIYNLTQTEIEKLKSISRKVVIYLRQKSKGNKTKEIVLKNNFINQINNLQEKTDNKKLKYRLLFLKENI